MSADPRPRRRVCPGLRHAGALSASLITLAGALSASAHVGSTHPVSLTIRDAVVSHSGNRGTSAGVFSGRPFGHGVVVQRVAIMSTNGPTATSKVAFTIFTSTGTLTGAGRSTRTTNPDGTVTVAGTRTITGGTRAYRGARGRLTVTATAVNGVTTSHWQGRLDYGPGGRSGGARPHKLRRYSFTSAIRSVAVASSGSPPASGSNTQASLVNGTIGGKRLHGAGRGVNTFPSPGRSHTVGVVFGPEGSIDFTITATGTANPDGSFSFRGKGKITGGTGAYRGARGTFTETQGRAPTTAPSTATFKGTISY